MRHFGSDIEAIVLGGMIAGVLDIADAIVFWAVRSGAAPIRILQSIASGLQGARAFQGGMTTAAIGLALHFSIALVAAAVYVTASHLLPVLVRRPVVCGLAYGVAVYFFMNDVVLPLSAFRQSTSVPPAVFVNGMLIHALGVGLPIALCASRSARRTVGLDVVEADVVRRP